jgi:cobaltochelatase CobT
MTVKSCDTEDLRRMGAHLRATSIGVFQALAGSPGQYIVDDSATSRASGDLLVVEIPSSVGSQGVSRWRGHVDAAALLAHFSNRRIHASRRPTTGAARSLFDMLEQNRVDALGARRYVGVRANLAALVQERWARARPEGVVRGQLAGWIETFALLSRIPMAAPLPESVYRSLAASWREWMTETQADAVSTLSTLIWNQDTYAAQSLRVIGTLLDVRAESLRGARSEDRAEKGGERKEAGSKGFMHAQGFGQTPDPLGAMEAVPVSAASAADGKSAPYQVFTKAYDACIDAGDLCDPEALAQRRRELDLRIGNRLSAISRWAHRLQRKLLGLQMRAWQFDMEEGELDVGRLSRVATHPLEPLVFKRESEIQFPATVVSLLVDNSGSMRGVPIATAAVCAELLGRVLERCGVKTEILGFTTRSWRGGRAYRDWVAAGRCANPGRLAELRHVVYKSADQPWRRASARLGAMLADDLLKENIDGEALLWAHERLLQRLEPRKILVVISDGAPLDDTTLQANDPGYLERHLRSVIEAIERRSSVELIAIGIGHDVCAYYRRAVALQSADDLSEAIVTQLINLFGGAGGLSSGPRNRRRSGVRSISSRGEQV